MEEKKGGVAILALNTDPNSEQRITIPAAADRYTLTAADVASTAVSLNGHDLQAGSDGSIPPIAGQPVEPGTLHLPPASINFLTFPSAQNKNCM
jgi:heparanase